jgi:hypothetical protein
MLQPGAEALAVPPRIEVTEFRDLPPRPAVGISDEHLIEMERY